MNKNEKMPVFQSRTCLLESVGSKAVISLILPRRQAKRHRGGFQRLWPIGDWLLGEATSPPDPHVFKQTANAPWELLTLADGPGPGVHQ